MIVDTLPLKGQSDLRGGRDGEPIEMVSKTNLELLQIARSPRVLRGKYEIYDSDYGIEEAVENSADWNPSHFRPFVAHTLEEVEVALKRERE